MILIDQTEFSNVELGTHGNCLSACLATITGIDIAVIPNFATLYATTGSWYPEFRQFLFQHGYVFRRYFYFPQNGTWDDLLKSSTGIDGYFICGGTSPRGTSGGHAAIYKDGIMIHDPHPSRAGLVVLEDAMIIEKVQ